MAAKSKTARPEKGSQIGLPKALIATIRKRREACINAILDAARNKPTARELFAYLFDHDPRKYTDFLLGRLNISDRRYPKFLSCLEDNEMFDQNLLKAAFPEETRQFLLTAVLHPLKWHELPDELLLFFQKRRDDTARKRKDKICLKFPRIGVA